MKKEILPTEGMHYRGGYKAALQREWKMTIPTWFRFPMDFDGLWEQDNVKVTDSQLTLMFGFMWNFANWFPDFEWVRVPSGAHDALLKFREDLISRNVITEGGPEDKALKEDIDTVFMLLCKERLPKWADKTPKIMFIGVNRLSRIAPGKQSDDHRVRYVR